MTPTENARVALTEWRDHLLDAPSQSRGDRMAHALGTLLAEHETWADQMRLLRADEAELHRLRTLAPPTDALTGRIVAVALEDGIEREPCCGLERCECPDHDGPPPPAGTYITILLDRDVPVGLWNVVVSRATDGNQEVHRG